MILINYPETCKLACLFYNSIHEIILKSYIIPNTIEGMSKVAYLQLNQSSKFYVLDKGKEIS